MKTHEMNLSKRNLSASRALAYPLLRHWRWPSVKLKPSWAAAAGWAARWTAPAAKAGLAFALAAWALVRATGQALSLFRRVELVRERGPGLPPESEHEWRRNSERFMHF